MSGAPVVTLGLLLVGCTLSTVSVLMQRGDGSDKDEERSTHALRDMVLSLLATALYVHGHRALARGLAGLVALHLVADLAHCALFRARQPDPTRQAAYWERVHAAEMARLLPAWRAAVRVRAAASTAPTAAP